MAKYIKLEDLMKFPIRLNHYDKEHGDVNFVYGIETVLEYAENLQTTDVVQEWISVEDRLPDNKEYDWVLAQVVEDNGFMHIPTVMEYRQSKNDWFEETYGWLSEHNGAFTVTHWMPLPEPPKGGK